MSVRSPYQIARQISGSPLYLKNNIIADRTWSFAYIRYRVLRPLLKLYYRIFQWLNPETPWTAPAAVKIFRQILDKQMIGFEYGSGNSTIFFSKALRHLTSVEHDENWYKVVRSRLRDLGADNVDYKFVPPYTNGQGPYSFYRDFHLKESDFMVKSEYSNYFSLISQYPDSHFDFIMVDGRARVECSLNAISKLKPGGLFVLDNSDRARYRVIFRVLQDWKVVTTTTGLFDTTIWFKP